MPHIFEPFFTTKDKDKGTGLGLASVYGAVKHNKGFINADSEPGQGTTFKLYYPEISRPEDAGESPHQPVEATKAVAVLLVEDNTMVRDLTRTMLEALGHEVDMAATPEKALAICSDRQQPFDLLLTDVVLPQMSGKDLKKSVEAWFPNIKTLFMSGYTANVIAHHGVLEKDVSFLQKPFTIEDLAEKIQEAIIPPAP
jgi:CheY-like chemotaxis protein